MITSVTPRRILHIDMDAFFVSVELLDRPELRGTPVVVGGTGTRGVVAAASYEARAYGIHSAMPSVTARRLCPQATYLSGRHDRYAEVSADLMRIFGRVTPIVEPLSLDEAFLDVTGSTRAFGAAAEIGSRVRHDVRSELGLTCSVGVATTKFIAKLASERAKPSPSATGPVFGPGVFEVEPGREIEFLHPLPVEALWGVGPATLTRLQRLGVTTVCELAALPIGALTSALGSAAGHHLFQLAHAIDDRPVVADLRPKSVSHEETFAVDQRDRGALEAELLRMTDAVASRLRRSGIVGRTLTLKVRFAGFQTITRSLTLPEPTDDGALLMARGRDLLAAIDVSQGVRLLGVGVSNLDDGAVRQLSFDLSDDDHVGSSERAVVNEAVDAIRDRFGAAAIGPARLVDAHGLRTFRTGQQQWGPDADSVSGD